MHTPYLSTCVSVFWAVSVRIVSFFAIVFAAALFESIRVGIAIRVFLAPFDIGFHIEIATIRVLILLIFAFLIQPEVIIKAVFAVLLTCRKVISLFDLLRFVLGFFRWWVLFWLDWAVYLLWRVLLWGGVAFFVGGNLLYRWMNPIILSLLHLGLGLYLLYSLLLLGALTVLLLVRHFNFNKNNQ